MLKGDATVGVAVSLVTYARTISTPVQYISAVMSNFARSFVSGKFVAKLLKIPQVNGDGNGIPFQKDIKMDNVTWKVTNRTVISNFCMRVNRGETVILWGPSGCGKTTILRILIGDTVPEQGTVEVGGVNVKCANRKEYWKYLSIVPQKNCFIPGTILQNVLLGTNVAEEEARQLLNKMGLGYLDLEREIRSMKDLSGGEGRCLMLARALLKNAPFYFIDEPTTGMDFQMKMNVINLLREKLKGKTAIIVTHDPFVKDALRCKVIQIEGCN